MNHDNMTGQLIEQEIERLGEGFHRTLGRELLVLVAALRLHGFAVQRADGSEDLLDKSSEIWAEMNTPSIWLYAKSTMELYSKMQKMAIDDPEYLKLNDYITRQNLTEQHRLLRLLEEFYSRHTPASFYSRLIVQAFGDEGESGLVPQGANAGIIMPNDERRRLHGEFLAEMLAFGNFLANKL